VTFGWCGPSLALAVPGPPVGATLWTNHPDTVPSHPYDPANQWPSLLVYTHDGRLTIDNGPAEQAIRPPAVGRNNWLHVGGHGGLRPAAVLLSLAASVRRHGVNPWAYFRHVLSELPARPRGTDPTDLLPDAWRRSRGRPPRGRYNATAPS
jgi:hypothetical protein